MSEPSLPTADRANGYFKDLNNWGRWGNDDQLGTLNLITPAKLLQGQRLISTGRAVSLARDVIPRPVYMYHVTYPAKRERVDVVRGVFLDVAAARPQGFVTVGKPVTPRELDECERRAGVRVEPGDVVVLRSGDAAFRRANPDWVPRVSPHPGLHLSCLEWFRSKDIAAIAWDMMDERPSGYPGFGMAVHLAIPFLGLALVDNVDPERLAQACAEHGRNEFLFTATPLRLVGATGAPAHPIAIF
jgi:kynurenine formamidase